MPGRIYAAFEDHKLGRKAVGALLDHGAQAGDIRVLYQEGVGRDDQDLIQKARSGITTTTRADAAAGACTGVGIGAGLAALAGLGTLVIPGFGVVLSGPAGVLALLAAVATVAAGALAGGLLGFLRDQGSRRITSHPANPDRGGALLAVGCPTGKLTSSEIRRMLVKYRSSNMRAYGESQTVPTGPGASLDSGATC